MPTKYVECENKCPKCDATLGKAWQEFVDLDSNAVYLFFTCSKCALEVQEIHSFIYAHTRYAAKESSNA